GPDVTWACNVARSKGPVWLWPTATWNIDPPGIGGGEADAAPGPPGPAAPPVIEFIICAPIAMPAPSPMPAPAAPPGLFAASWIDEAVSYCVYACKLPTAAMAPRLSIAFST